MQHFLPSRVAVLQLATPAISVVLSALVLGESVGGELIIGVAVVAFGSALAQRE